MFAGETVFFLNTSLWSHKCELQLYSSKQTKLINLKYLIHRDDKHSTTCISTFTSDLILKVFWIKLYLNAEKQRMLKTEAEKNKYLTASWSISLHDIRKTCNEDMTCDK